MLDKLDQINSNALQFNEEVSGIVERICRPLSNNFGITNFGYVKIFKDGTMLRLSMDKGWSRKYFQHQFYNDVNFYNFNNILPNCTRANVITNTPLGEHYSALYDHNIWNILTLSRRESESIEISFFSADRNTPEIINLYINHRDILEKFVQYFKKKVSSMITTPDPSILITTELKIQQVKCEENKNIQKFLEEIGQVGSIFKFSLSARELECVQHIMLGKTMKEIARSLDISPRTVESYINSAKEKAGCRKISQLIKNLFENF